MRPDLSKMRTARATSNAAGSEVQIGEDIPDGMKMMVWDIIPINNTTTLTTLDIFAGIATSKTAEQYIESLPILPNNAVGAQDSILQGKDGRPIMVIESRRTATGVTVNQMYLQDGGQRVNVTINYTLEYA